VDEPQREHKLSSWFIPLKKVTLGPNFTSREEKLIEKQSIKRGIRQLFAQNSEPTIINDQVAL
jgi:hypothetical protein